MFVSCCSPGTVRSPGHVAIEEIRGGAGSGGGDLLGLLLLFSLAANVAQGAERLCLETPRLPLTSWHPWNKTKEKQEALPLPSSTTCCTQLYRQPLPNKLLRKIIHVELQEADGDCHLQAIVLHLARRSVCVHPQNRSLARWFERHGKRVQRTTQLKAGTTNENVFEPPTAKLIKQH